jgi:hypothetical protein
MKRSVNEYDKTPSGGYNIPQLSPRKDRGEEVMGKIALGMGVPAGVALVAGRVGEGDRNAAQREKAADAKRESDAEMKRESRGVQKPANFDATQESIQDAKDAKDRAKIKSMGFAKGGKVSSASKRADGCATKGKTRGKFI